MAFSSATGGGKAAPRGPGPDAVWPSPSAARPARGKRTPRSPRLALANTFAIAGGSASEEVPGELPALVPRSLTRTAHGHDLGRGGGRLLRRRCGLAGCLTGELGRGGAAPGRRCGPGRRRPRGPAAGPPTGAADGHHLPHAALSPRAPLVARAPYLH